MKKILVPIKSKIKPIEVSEEIKKFKCVHKSPYSQTYYDTDNISWEHKPEGSLRISDHWNFESKGKKHCELYDREEYIDNNWILAKYKSGKYYILKEFGEGIDGYLYKPLYKLQIEALKGLYEFGGMEKSYNYYKKQNIKPPFVREGYIKNVKGLSKFISLERIQKFKSKNPKIKKVVFIEEQYLNVVEKLIKIYYKADLIDKEFNENKDTKALENKYRPYKLNCEKEESMDEVYTLVLDNNIAIDFKL